jgi:uncharacterized protein YqhQ
MPKNKKEKSHLEVAEVKDIAEIATEMTAEMTPEEKAKAEEQEKIHKSKIGGQALIEGVMRRGVKVSAMACRLPNGTIDVEKWDDDTINVPKIRKVLFIRGIINFVSTLVGGYKCLMKSAEKQMTEDELTPNKGVVTVENVENVEEVASESTATAILVNATVVTTDGEAVTVKKESGGLMAVFMIIAMVIGIALGFFLFSFLPTKAVALLDQYGLVADNILKTVIEGVIKIVGFVIYLACTALMKDIRRTYEYHGAEHKTIACFEAKEELTIENVKKHSRFHPRCGTSFIFIVLMISIFVHCFIGWEGQLLVRVGIQLLLLPLIVGISYELIKLAGKYNNPITRIISAPGLWLQRISTREPDEPVIEVAIAAILPCLPENLEEDKW